MLRRASGVVLGTVLTGVLLLGATACSSGGDGTVENAGGRDTADPARSLVDSKCSMCHTLDRVYTASKTQAEWETTVTRMKSNGLVVTDEEYTTIIEFLGN